MTLRGARLEVPGWSALRRVRVSKPAREDPMTSKKSKVFIGSSKEGKKVAEALKLELGDVATSTIWSEGVFGIGKNYLESLTDALSNYEFAILVLTPDNEAQVRAAEVRLPRDNVLFELGLFMGQYGKKRVFVAQEETTKLLSDFEGIVTAKFSMEGRCDHKRIELRQIVGASAIEIKSAIEDAQIAHVDDRAVHYIPPTLSHNQYYAQLQVGLEAEFAKLRNTSWHCHPPPGDSPEDVYLELEVLLRDLGTHARRTDLVALVPIGDKKQRRQLSDIVAKDMETKSRCQIIFLDWLPPRSLLKHERVSFVGVDNHQVGVIAAFAICEALKDEPETKYLVFRGPGGSARANGFTKGVEFFARGTTTVIPIADKDRFEILEDVFEGLAPFPLDQPLGIFAGNDEIAAAVIRVAEDQGRERMRVVGCDKTREMRFSVDSRSCALATVDTNLRNQTKKILQVRKGQLSWLQEPMLYPRLLQRAFSKSLNDRSKLKELWEVSRARMGTLTHS